MKKIAGVYAAICFLLNFSLFAQNKTLFHYPLEKGTSWEYEEKSGGIILRVTREVIGDTLLPNGKTYKIVEQIHQRDGKHLILQRIVKNEIYQYSPRFVPPDSVAPEEVLLFKLEVEVGDKWPYPFSGVSYDSCFYVVEEIGVMNFANRNWKKAVFNTITVPTSLCTGNIVFLDSLGVFLNSFEGGHLRLLGAIINGRRFGTITSKFNKPSPWPFYPLHFGNSWRYQVSFNGGIWGYNLETILDSLKIQGGWFWKKQIQEYTGGKGFAFIRQKDSTYIVESPGSNQSASFKNLYKIDAKVGETWIVEASLDSSYKFWGKLEADDSTEIFGKIKKTKNYRLWRETNGRLESEWFTVITKGLGLTKLRGGNGAADLQNLDLVGAIINGIEFGDPVSVNQDINSPMPDIFIVNYPNPFTTTTTIKIELPKFTSKQIVSIAVYDVTGRLIHMIYDGIVLPERQFQTEWDGRSNFKQRVCSGNYFLEVRIGNQKQTKRVILLR